MLNAMVKPPRIEEPDDQPEDPFTNIEDFKDRGRRASDFLKALAHENRLLILCLIAEKERSVTELETLLSLRQPAVSQQLARLRMDGLVATRREGKAIYYRLASDRVRRIMSVMYDVFCRGDIDGEPTVPAANHRARS